MDANPVVGTRIRAARKGARLTQVELAKALGVEQAFLSKLELGKSDPRASALATIAEACGVTTDWLLFGRGDGPPMPEPAEAAETPAAADTEAA